MWAAYWGHKKNVKLLLEAKAKIDVANKNGMKRGHFLVSGQYVERSSKTVKIRGHIASLPPATI